VLLLVLFATGAVDIGGGSDSDSDSDAPTSATSSGGSTSAADSKLTQAILEPVDGGDAEGTALFGMIGKDVVLQVTAEGLDPTSPGESYSIWLYRSPKLVLRVGAVRVGEDGRLAAQLAIPAQLLAYVANGAFSQIAVSLLPEQEYKSALAEAKERKQLPGYLGEDTLRGRIVGPAIEAK